MPLTLYLHPLSSFCHKVLIGLYENATPFVPQIVNLGDPVARDEFKKIWPFAKFPVLRDEARGRTEALHERRGPRTAPAIRGSGSAGRDQRARTAIANGSNGRPSRIMVARRGRDVVSRIRDV